MPNQNPHDPNQNQPQGGSSSIPLSPQADLPPLPPEFQSVVETKVDDNGSAAPPEPEVTNLVNAPKKKFGTKKIIATILGILLLVGGVGAGIALTSQKQLFQQKAAPNCTGTCYANSCSSLGMITAIGECDPPLNCCKAATPVPTSKPACTSAGGTCYANSCSTLGLIAAEGTCDLPLNCCKAATPTCSGTCKHALTCDSIGLDNATGNCSLDDYVCCKDATPTPTSKPGTCAANEGECYTSCPLGYDQIKGDCNNAPKAPICCKPSCAHDCYENITSCQAIGQVSGNGSCAGDAKCCRIPCSGTCKTASGWQSCADFNMINASGQCYAKQDICCKTGSGPTSPPNPTTGPTTPPTSCGKVPSPLPNFTKPPFTISTSSLAATAQKLWIHIYGSGQVERKVNISLNGTTKVITVQEGGKYDTGLTVKKGDDLKITGIQEPDQDAKCAPDKTKPSMSFAWMAPNSNNTCGTTLPDPDGKPFKPMDITNYLKYIANSKNTVLSSECWADWREWPGDYDFDDFFLTFSVSGSTSAPYCAAVKVYDTNWNPVGAGSDDVKSNPVLRSGTKYRFTALGSPVAGIQKARIKFTLSDGTLTTKYSTQKKPNTNEYYVEYTVPAGTTSLDVKAQVSDGTTWY